MISSREELWRRLRDVVAVEMTARDGYLQDLATFKNFEITDTIAHIKRDEDEHIILLNELMAMLDKNA